LIANRTLQSFREGLRMPHFRRILGIAFVSLMLGGDLVPTTSLDGKVLGGIPRAMTPVSHLSYPSLGFDMGKCIESCDNQFSRCEQNGNDNRYCSNQHDRCRTACIQH
jgi:hypothetical protein